MLGKNWGKPQKSKEKLQKVIISQSSRFYFPLGDMIDLNFCLFKWDILTKMAVELQTVTYNDFMIHRIFTLKPQHHSRYCLIELPLILPLLLLVSDFWYGNKLLRKEEIEMLFIRCGQAYSYIRLKLLEEAFGGPI